MNYAAALTSALEHLSVIRATVCELEKALAAQDARLRTIEKATAKADSTTMGGTDWS